MKLRTLLSSLLIAVALTGCYVPDQQSAQVASPFALPPAVPVYEIKPEFDRSNQLYIMVVHVHKDTAELNASFRELFPDTEMVVDGFATWDDEKNVCIMHVTKPLNLGDKNAVDTWGHELLHCVYGAYHVPGAR